MTCGPNKGRLRVAFCALALLVLSSCGSALMDGSTPESKQAVLDAVNIALSTGQCAKAISIIEPVYNSKYSDNDIRLSRATAQVCAAHLDFFSLLGNIAENASDLTGGLFWNLLTQLFPSNVQTIDPTDRVLEGAENSMDALMSIINVGQVLVPTYEVDATGFNPISLIYSDRSNDANAYMTFVSMAAIGSFQSRYGAPDSTNNYKRTKLLPWTTATASGMSTDGCQYASSLVNFVDSMGVLSTTYTGAGASSIQTLLKTFQQGIYLACEIGCHNLPGVSTTGTAITSWVPAGCPNLAASLPTLDPTTISTTGLPDDLCSTCPLLLRNRSACTGLADDPASCAAAALISFINYEPLLGWTLP